MISCTEVHIVTDIGLATCSGGHSPPFDPKVVRHANSRLRRLGWTHDKPAADASADLSGLRLNQTKSRSTISVALFLHSVTRMLGVFKVSG